MLNLSPAVSEHPLTTHQLRLCERTHIEKKILRSKRNVDDVQNPKRGRRVTGEVGADRDGNVNSVLFVTCVLYFLDNRPQKLDTKSYESTLVVPPPNVTSVLLNHDKPAETERSPFQPVSVHAVQKTLVVKHRFEEVHSQKQPSKRVPVKIVQDNRKSKPKTETSKPEAPAAKPEAPVVKTCASVSLKQVNRLGREENLKVLSTNDGASSYTECLAVCG